MSHERCFGNSLVTIQSFKISTHLQQGEIQMTDRDYEQLEEERIERRQICDHISEMAPWLAEEIAACMEMSYRRGVQQGAYLNAPDALNGEWRFSPYGDSSRYKTAITPPNGKGPAQTALSKHRSEAANASAAVAHLLNAAHQ